MPRSLRLVLDLWVDPRIDFPYYNLNSSQTPCYFHIVFDQRIVSRSDRDLLDLYSSFLFRRVMPPPARPQLVAAFALQARAQIQGGLLPYGRLVPPVRQIFQNKDCQ